METIVNQLFDLLKDTRYEFNESNGIVEVNNDEFSFIFLQAIQNDPEITEIIDFIEPIYKDGSRVFMTKEIFINAKFNEPKGCIGFHLKLTNDARDAFNASKKS